ncbi:MAG TPA: FCD domain-containing protein [Flexivirga sp.]|uniref:FadR/GntR family transcriptional regulator n=1 Tax=Flexivirga sp. TaxID=1962927 RepID=UPI002C2F9EC1|nr:FCD domain-containing protein [Flexivirga sp.]HWC21240.1 FCD domain-containing protein [Flexivirga sp.]
MSADVPPKKAWELVVAWVEDRILSGEYVVGSHLPAERDLAQRVGVSRPAVREAVRTLEASGVVRSAVGAGAAGGTRITGVPHTALTRLLRLHVALASFPTTDVTEVRVALERLSTRLASRRASAGDVAQMQQLLVAMDDDELTMAEFNDYDTGLHVAIAEAAGNRLASDLTIAIRESMRLPILSGLAALDSWTDTREILRAQHHAVVAAISAQDAEHAVTLMEEHIRTAYDRMTSLHP